MNTINLEAFWSQKAKDYLDWLSPWSQVLEGDFSSGKIRWFQNAKLNVSANCIDRHLALKADAPAIIWEGDEEGEQRILSFKALHVEVCLMANVFKALGITKGDRVAIYLPMIPEAAIAMLACARIGAVHTVVFAGFSTVALRQRLEDAHCKLLITADGYQRGGQYFEQKQKADEARLGLDIPCLLIKNSQKSIHFNPKVDHWWHELKQKVSSDCKPEPMDAEDPLFVLYTSGSTGKPKGLVHTTGGYLVQVAYSHDYVFHCKNSEVFWCTADVGWITGHSYLVYGPLCNGITTLLFGGVPTWPTPARCWEMIDRHQVAVFYTAPTAIRALKREGDQWLTTTTRQSLRLLGTVGEPINPEVWEWYKQKVGLNRCPIVDTWWQTETGAILIAPQADRPLAKPGAACTPLPGIYPVLLDEQRKALKGVAEGALALKYPWPSIARTILGDHQRYCETYFHKGYYYSGDGASRDEDGDFWIRGRMDDVLNVSGHRLGTAEIESALVEHPHIAEAAVVGIPHEIKGEGIHAFVSLKSDHKPSKALEEALINLVKTQIGAIAKPDVIQWVTALPITRSGKIMRRILRQIASKKVSELSELGDLSTLANPQSVHILLEQNKTEG
jgi:acetyl-CoA synthetase